MNKPIILIVDDNPLDIFLLKRQLAKIGIDNDVRAVHDGQEVYAYLQGQDFFVEREQYPYPALILLDINMPTSGFDVLGFLRSHPRHRHIPVIALTGDSDPSYVTKAYRLGARAFLTKPVEPGSLLSMLNGVANLKTTENELVVDEMSSSALTAA